MSGAEALFHLSVKIGQRSNGRSAVAAAAYRAAARLEDRRLGRTYNYERKSAVAHRDIVVPDGAPSWATDRSELWNRAEESEARCDAVVWREVEISLPRGLGSEQRLALLRDGVAPYVDAGAVADICIHNPAAVDKQEQPHAHVMLTMRALDPATPHGFGRRKNDALAMIFESGGRRGGTKGDALRTERARWAEVINRHLAAAGIERRADARSYRDRGIDREPEPHMGERAMERWRRGGGMSTRMQEVAAKRGLKRAQEALRQVEENMAQERQNVKAKLLQQRFPNLTIPDGTVIHMVDIKRPGVTRIMMRDDSWCEVQGDRIRLYGPQGSARALAEAIAESIDVDPAVIAYEPKLGRMRRRGAPRQAPRLTAEQAASVAEIWRQRGYVDITEAPDGVWVKIGRARIQDQISQVTMHGPEADPEAIRALVAHAGSQWGAMATFGSEKFRGAVWLEAQRQGVEVVDYEPPKWALRKWEQELAQRQQEEARQERRQGVHAAIGTQAALAVQVANYAAERSDTLNNPPLKAFIDSLSDRERSALGAMQPYELIPRLSEMREKGQALSDAPGGAAPPKPRPDHDKAPTGPRPTVPGSIR